MDQLVKEFGDELLNISVVDEKAECDPAEDVKDLEQLFSKDPLSLSMDVLVHMVVVDTNVALKPISQQQHGTSLSSKPSTNMGMVRREMKYPLRYNFTSSFPCTIANSHP